MARGGQTFGSFLINWVHAVLYLGLAVCAALVLSRISTARDFARCVFWVCAVLVMIGLLTPDGLWLISTTYTGDVSSGRIPPVSPASW